MGDDVVRPQQSTVGARRWMTAAAWGLAVVCSAVLLVVGLFLLAVFPLAVQGSTSAYCENGDHPGPCPGVVELFGPGLLVLSAGILCLVAAVRFRPRRSPPPAVGDGGG